MSGHSKWAKIKRAKGAADAQRGSLFTKVIKEISIAARMGGGDPEANPRLRTAIIKARGANMPKDNIERAIKKGTGELGAAVFEELAYEARLGETAILIEVLTDNRNRAAADVRNILTRAGAELAKSGSVSRLLTRKGVITLDGEKYTEDAVMEAALDGGAEDVSSGEGIIEVSCAPEDFEAVINALTEKSFETRSAAIDMIPEAPIQVDKDAAGKVQRLVEKLEENDDVQNVYTNVEYPDDFDPDE
jgi:YebC/PmpR family DNA-binding regulatory protein